MPASRTLGMRFFMLNNSGNIIPSLHENTMGSLAARRRPAGRQSLRPFLRRHAVSHQIRLDLDVPAGNTDAAVSGQQMVSPSHTGDDVVVADLACGAGALDLPQVNFGSQRPEGRPGVSGLTLKRQTIPGTKAPSRQVVAASDPGMLLQRSSATSRF